MTQKLSFYLSHTVLKVSCSPVVKLQRRDEGITANAKKHGASDDEQAKLQHTLL